MEGALSCWKTLGTEINPLKYEIFELEITVTNAVERKGNEFTRNAKYCFVRDVMRKEKSWICELQTCLQRKIGVGIKDSAVVHAGADLG